MKRVNKNLEKNYDSPQQDWRSIAYSPFTFHVSRLVREALHLFRKKYHRDFWALKDVFPKFQNRTRVLMLNLPAGKSYNMKQIAYGPIKGDKINALDKERRI